MKSKSTFLLYGVAQINLKIQNESLLYSIFNDLSSYDRALHPLQKTIFKLQFTKTRLKFYFFLDLWMAGFN